MHVGAVVRQKIAAALIHRGDACESENFFYHASLSIPKVNTFATISFNAP